MPNTKFPMQISVLEFWDWQIQTISKGKWTNLGQPSQGKSVKKKEIFFIVINFFMVIERSKELFSFSRYSNFYISILPSFFPCQLLLQRMIQDKFWSLPIVNGLNKNLITHFVWYFEKEKSYGIETLSIDRVLNKEDF